MKKFFVSVFLFVSAFVFSFSAGALVSASESSGGTEEVLADVMTETKEFEGDLLYSRMRCTARR